MNMPPKEPTREDVIKGLKAIKELIIHEYNSLAPIQCEFHVKCLEYAILSLETEGADK